MPATFSSSANTTVGYQPTPDEALPGGQQPIGYQPTPDEALPDDQQPKQEYSPADRKPVAAVGYQPTPDEALPDDKQPWDNLPDAAYSYRIAANKAPDPLTKFVAPAEYTSQQKQTIRDAALRHEKSLLNPRAFEPDPFTPEEEGSYAAWKAQNVKTTDDAENYDYRTAYQNKATPDPVTGQWSSQYRKPTHPEFSGRSIYAAKYPDLAGREGTDKFLPPSFDNVRKYTTGRIESDEYATRKPVTPDADLDAAGKLERGREYLAQMHDSGITLTKEQVALAGKSIIADSKKPYDYTTIAATALDAPTAWAGGVIGNVIDTTAATSRGAVNAATGNDNAQKMLGDPTLTNIGKSAVKGGLEAANELATLGKHVAEGSTTRTLLARLNTPVRADGNYELGRSPLTEDEFQKELYKRYQYDNGADKNLDKIYGLKDEVFEPSKGLGAEAANLAIFGAAMKPIGWATEAVSKAAFEGALDRAVLDGATGRVRGKFTPVASTVGAAAGGVEKVADWARRGAQKLADRLPGNFSGNAGAGVLSHQLGIPYLDKIAAVTSTIKGLPKTLEGIQEGAMGLRKIAEASKNATGQISTLERVAADTTNPDWLRNLARASDSSVRVVTDGVVPAAKALTKGAAINLAMTDNPNSEEIGSAIGMGAAFETLLGGIGHSVESARKSRVKQDIVWFVGDQQARNGTGPAMSAMAKLNFKAAGQAATIARMAEGRFNFDFLSGQDFIDRTGRGAAGHYSPATNSIIINVDSPTFQAHPIATMAHEMGHALSPHLQKAAPELYAQVKMAFDMLPPETRQALRYEYARKIVAGDVATENRIIDAENARVTEENNNRDPNSSEPEQPLLVRVELTPEMVEKWISRKDAESASKPGEEKWDLGEVFAEFTANSVIGEDLDRVRRGKTSATVSPTPIRRELARRKAELAAFFTGREAEGKDRNTQPTFGPNLDKIFYDPKVRKVIHEGISRTLGTGSTAGKAESNTQAERTGVSVEAPITDVARSPVFGWSPGTRVETDAFKVDENGVVTINTPEQIRAVDRSRKRAMETFFEAQKTAGKSSKWSTSERPPPEFFSALERGGFSPEMRGKIDYWADMLNNTGLRPIINFWNYGVGTTVGSKRSWAASVRSGKGNIAALERSVVPAGIQVSKAGNVLLEGFDLSVLSRKMNDWQASGRLTPWSGDIAAATTDMVQYLQNHYKNVPGEQNLGTAKRDVLNALIVGRGNAESAGKNPVRDILPEAEKQGIYRSFRTERMTNFSEQKNPSNPGYYFDYSKQQGNLKPESGSFKPESKDTGNFKSESLDKETGFYSKLYDYASAKLPARGTPEQILATLDPARGSGIKKEELELMGLPQFLAGKTKVSKEEILQRIKENSLDVEEVVKTVGGHGSKQYAVLDQSGYVYTKFNTREKADDYAKRVNEKKSQQVLADYGARILYNGPEGKFEVHSDGYTQKKSFNTEADAKDYADHLNENLLYEHRSNEGLYVDERHDKNSYTKYAGVGDNPKYRTKGGANYTERLFTLIDKAGRNLFEHPHWDSIKNVMFHLRTSDFLKGGRKVRLIDELQSDWVKRIKKYGIKGEKGHEEVIERAREEYSNAELDLGGYQGSRTGNLHDDPIHDQLKERFALAGEAYTKALKAVEDLPVKKSWEELAFKYALRDAVRDGMDTVAWITGETATERFSITRDVSRLEYDPRNHRLIATYNTGEIRNENVHPSSLPGYIGDELAGKLLGTELTKPTESDTLPVHELEGDDLKLSGTGMKQAYDVRLPSVVKKYTKPWGGEVELMDLGQGDTVHSMEITPEMRQSVLDGQAIFKPENGDLGPAAGQPKPGDNKIIRTADPGYKSDRSLGPRPEGNETISARIPTAAKAFENADAELLSIGLSAILEDKPLSDRFAEIIKEYPIIGPDLPKDADTATVIHKFITGLKENLVSLYNSVDPEIRERTAKWYVGANVIGKRMAEKFDQPVRAACAVLAALSPQMDWNMNVSFAGRVMDTWKNHQNTVTTPEMMGWLRDQLASFDGKKDPESIDTFRAIMGVIEGKTFGEVYNEMPLAGGWWLRAHDEVHRDRSYNLVTPEGDFVGVATEKNGANAVVSWTSTPNIAKALSVLSDSSLSNISRRMGRAHKVRSFYNNIVDPSDAVSVTMDTHAIAAALFQPLGSGSKEVKEGWKDAGTSGITGVNGLYGLYAEAYRRAAAEVGILPREMQSIVWEAVKSLFRDDLKRNKEIKKYAEDTWIEYADGKITSDEARKKIVDRFGGFRRPEWAGRSGQNIEATRDPSVGYDASNNDVRPPKPSPVKGPRAIARERKALVKKQDTAK